MKGAQPYRQFDFSLVFTQTKAFIDQHNEQQQKLTQKLNANHRATAELIIRLYLKQLNSISEKFDIENKELPGFKTFNSTRIMH